MTISRHSNAGKPYSRTVAAGGFAYTAGFTGESADGGVPDDFAEQCALIFNKARRALADVGGTLSDVVSVTVYVTAPGDYKLLDGPFAEVFADAPPVRACVVVKGLSSPAKRVEMQFVAFIGDKNAASDQEGRS